MKVKQFKTKSIKQLKLTFSSNQKAKSKFFGFKINIFEIKCDFWRQMHLSKQSTKKKFQLDFEFFYLFTFWISNEEEIFKVILCKKKNKTKKKLFWE